MKYFNVAGKVTVNRRRSSLQHLEQSWLLCSVQGTQWKAYSDFVWLERTLVVIGFSPKQIQFSHWTNRRKDARQTDTIPYGAQLQVLLTTGGSYYSGCVQQEEVG
jgi:hypothetical protein